MKAVLVAPVVSVSAAPGFLIRGILRPRLLLVFFPSQDIQPESTQVALQEDSLSPGHRDQHYFNSGLLAKMEEL